MSATATSTTDLDKTIGETARIGRFFVEVVRDEMVPEPLVSFMLQDGREFGSIRLTTAMDPIVVDLYESAMWRLGLPLNFDVDDYCLNKHELFVLRTWTNDIVERCSDTNA